MAQFVVAAICILWIGNVFAEQGAISVLLPCLLLWIALYSVGLISEQRAMAVRFEVARLLAIMPLGMYAMIRQGLLEGTASEWGALAVYIAVSAVLLQMASASRAVALGADP